jgi:hypothetical protein
MFACITTRKYGKCLSTPQDEIQNTKFIYLEYGGEIWVWAADWRSYSTNQLSVLEDSHGTGEEVDTLGCTRGYAKTR